MGRIATRPISCMSSLCTEEETVKSGVPQNADFVTAQSQWIMNIAKASSYVMAEQ